MTSREMYKRKYLLAKPLVTKRDWYENPIIPILLEIDVHIICNI
jgi:hypothetical protein